MRDTLFFFITSFHHIPKMQSGRVSRIFPIYAKNSLYFGPGR